MKNYTEIDGWFDDNDYEFFRSLILSDSTFKNMNEIFVEVGSFKGRSSAAIWDLISESRKNISLICVDTWVGSEEHQKGERHEDRDVVNNELYNRFVENMGSRIETIKSLKMTSLQASAYLDNNISAVFLDAAHDYKNVLLDIKSWILKIKPGGILCGHDYTWTTVKNAVNDYTDLHKLKVNNNNHNIWWINV